MIAVPESLAGQRHYVVAGGISLRRLTGPAGWVLGNQVPVLAHSRTTKAHFLPLPAPSCLLKVEAVLQCWTQELQEASKANILPAFVSRLDPCPLLSLPQDCCQQSTNGHSPTPQFMHPKVCLLPRCRITFHLEVRGETGAESRHSRIPLESSTICAWVSLWAAFFF